VKDRIVQRALQLGFDACRVTSATRPESGPHLQSWLDAGQHGDMLYLARNADKRFDPQKVLPGARSIITLAASYHAAPPQSDSPAPSGRVARYARYADYHDVLAPALKNLTDYVDQEGDTPRRSLWYVDTGPVLERDLAQRAGLGFIGKHTNLISRRLGNWFFIAEILTTVELNPDPPEKNRCGSCTRCITACPTEAILAPFHLDARRCISYLTIELKGSIPEPLRRPIGDRIYGCDDCLEVCPWNRFAREGRLMREQTRHDLVEPNLLELLALDEEGFRERFRGTPMRRTQRRGLLRNVAVALGNVGTDAARPALEKATHDKEPLVADHAQWALKEIKDRLGPSVA